MLPVKIHPGKATDIQPKQSNNTVMEYQLPLQYCPPKTRHSAANLREDQGLLLQSETHKFVEKSTIQPVKQLHVHITSPILLWYLKVAEVWRLIIDLRYRNSLLEPPHYVLIRSGNCTANAMLTRWELLQ